jgi:hypothetical protein
MVYQSQARHLAFALFAGRALLYQAGWPREATTGSPRDRI